MKMISEVSRSSLQKVLASVMLGVLVVGFGATPVQARPMDRDWHRHEVRAHGYWHGPHYAPAPVVYAPPVVYSPPPVEEQPEGINLVLPLHFR